MTQRFQLTMAAVAILVMVQSATAQAPPLPSNSGDGQSSRAGMLQRRAGMLQQRAGMLPQGAANAAYAARNSRASLGYEPRLNNTSWTYIQAAQPRKYSKHDMIFITVSETSQSSTEADVQRRKNALYNGVLEDWVRIVDWFTLKPAPQSDGDLSANGKLNQTYRAQGDSELRESLQLKITAEVADILPNGNLVLEAHKSIRVNNSNFEVSVTGICDPEDIAADRSIRSERILNLQLERRNRGMGRDATRRGWITLFIDEFNPF